MTKAISSLGTALALFACASPAIGSDDLFAPVLAYEAGLPRERPPACLATRTEGAAFDRDRQNIRSLREARPLNPRDAEIFRQHLAAADTRQFDWRLPVPLGERWLEGVARVDPEQARELDAAARSAIAAELAQTPSLAIDRSTVPPGLQARGALRRCSRLTLTAPFVTGDIAFIETNYVCGGLCGNGWLYALRRQEGRWRLVAIAFTWIS